MATSVSKRRTKWSDAGRENRSTSGRPIELTYDGKTPESEILRMSPIRLNVLWEGPHPTNRLYFGDNLPFLVNLLHDSSVCGQVKLIYIDPPFATNGVFQSRTQQDAYHDLLTGPSYIEFVRQRLILLRELLADDGSLYLHLDDNMIFHIKLIMDEVFGTNNFRNLITRRKSSHKNYTRKSYGNISDYILFYSKSDAYIWNRPVAAWTDERAKKEYTSIEHDTGRRYKKVPLHAPGVRNGATGQPWRGLLPPSGKHWQFTPKQLEEMDGRGEIYWSENGNPRRKIYLDNSDGVPLQNIWYEFRDTQNQNMRVTGYPTEKNSAMLSVIIQASSNSGDLVMDCFAGSGTTLEAASQLKRPWIGMDNSREALSTMLRRFAHGTLPMGDYVERAKHRTSKQHVLPLEADINVIGDALEAPIRPPLETNFTLYSAESSPEDVSDLLDEWRSWVDR